MKAFGLLAAGGPIAIGLAAPALWPDGAVLEWADPANVHRVARGRVVHAQHFVSCHREGLQGQPNWRDHKPDGRLAAPPHDDTGHTWHHPDEHLFQITKLGMKPPIAPVGYQSDMPSFDGTLGDDSIWAVLSFMKSTWSEKSRAYQDRIDQAYRKQACQD